METRRHFKSNEACISIQEETVAMLPDLILEKQHSVKAVGSI